MVSVDTNVIVRGIVGDDEAQAAAAKRVFESGPVFVATTVLLECEWVLRFTYRMDRERIAKVFAGIATMANVKIEDESCFLEALRLYDAGLDFADAQHLASSRECAEFATFDRAFARRAPQGACPVILLT